MSGFNLPDSIISLVQRLQVVTITWQGVAIQIPKFAVYATLSKPVFDKLIMSHGRQIALMKFGRYQVPILDPFRSDIDAQPNFVLIISHCRENRFGLYGYPADCIDEQLDMPFYHASVEHIVKDFV